MYFVRKKRVAIMKSGNGGSHGNEEMAKIHTFHGRNHSFWDWSWRFAGAFLGQRIVSGADACIVIRSFISRFVRNTEWLYML